MVSRKNKNSRNVFRDNCLSGKTALVTGAASGIGAEIARELNAVGATVFAADVSNFAEDNDLAGVFDLDVTSQTQWSNTIKNITKRAGALNILVNCAGVFELRNISDETVNGFERLVAVNQLGVFLGMQAALPAMKDKGGSIINMSSVAGLIGTPGTIAYSATKWAVRGMTKVAAIEFAPYSIRVNSIHPGAVRTPMLSSQPGVEDRAGMSSPLRRISEPNEVAAVAVFLASDASSYSTGAEFICDGGLSAK